MRGLCEGERFRGDPGSKTTPSETIQTGRGTMIRKKKRTTNAGAPVVDNQNIMTLGPPWPGFLAVQRVTQRKEKIA